MSYILDALRKSEQQRLATKPATASERVLITQPEPKRKSQRWLILLLFSNLLMLVFLAWFFTFNRNQALKQPVTNPINPTNTQRLQPKQPQLAAPQPKTPTLPAQPLSNLPSIAQLVESKKIIDNPKIKTVTSTEIPTKKKPPIKKMTASFPRNDIELETSDISSYNPPLQPPTNRIVDIAELPADNLNKLPNLSINVFSYAEHPEDRFVIIDMVKYKVGQLIKGQVKLKEIRPDSIIVQNGNNTVRIERP